MNKKFKFIKKKAVSPIIATVLLVAFSVALGAVVLNFTKKSTLDFSESAEDQIEINVKCNNVILKLVDLDKNPCYNRSFSKNFEVIVENQGNSDLEGFIITIFDFYGNPFNEQILENLSAHSRAKYNISLFETFNLPPIKAIISGIVSIKQNKLNVCYDNKIEIDEIDKC